MFIEEIYNNWLKHVDNQELKRELIKIKNSEIEKKDRFNKFLEFGTAGLRGIMGVGTNRINIYTIRKTTQGFANYINKFYKNPSVAISYDCRNKSKLFAYCCAEVLAGNNIKVYITSRLEPTPFLSFAVRQLKCSAGIMITASHNISKYNGYKCYDNTGSQIDIETASKIHNEILSVDTFKNIKIIKIQKCLELGLVNYIKNDVIDEYLNCVINQKINNVNFSNLNVVYTPLNGCGSNMVVKALNSVGVNNLKIVDEQKYPDGNFTTCKNPNPECIDAFELSINYAKSCKADIILATDPDADRIGVCVKHKGEYILLTGNQLGILIFNYIIKNKKKHINLYKNFLVIKTLVSSKMINSIAKHENCKVIEVPIGFKNIAKEIMNLENQNRLSDFIFGFEESNGYLCGTYTRDKDAISISVLVCEMVSYFKNNNLNLIDVFEKLLNKYGYYFEQSLNFEFNFSNKENFINKIKDYFINKQTEFLGKYKILNVKTYSNNELSNLICLEFGNETEILIRPSGTEPKLKIYILAKDDTLELLKEKIKILTDNINQVILFLKNSEEK